MLRFLLHLAFSIAISNWVYDELVLFDANLKPPLDRISEALRIPTHDQWLSEKNEEEFLVLLKGGPTEIGLPLKKEITTGYEAF